MAILINTKATPLLTKVVGKAGEIIPAYMGVHLDAGVIKYTTTIATSAILGITDRAYALGDDVAVIRRGESYAVCNEILSAGDALTCVAGKLVISNNLPGTETVVAIALIDAPAVDDRFVADVIISS